MQEIKPMPLIPASKSGFLLKMFPVKSFQGAMLKMQATICAERATVCSAVAAGVKTFNQMVIVADSESPCPPCGACRQFLFEFAPNLEIWITNLSGAVVYHRLQDLLPHAFGNTLLPGTKPHASESA